MISRKPERKVKVTESEVRKHISRAAISAVEQHRPKSVQLRLSREMLDRIDQVLAERAVKVPRHTWFLEAIASKLATEEVEPS